MGLPNKSQNKTQNIGLKIGDEVNFDKAKVADHFNEYFTSIASKLVEKLPKCDKYNQSQTFCYKQLCGRCLVHMTPVVKVVIHCVFALL